jgi:hypothetical protein
MGKHNDNRIENLCFLCPNCHSQTSTYCGKHLNKRKNKIEVCKKERPTKFKISKEELEKLVESIPMVKIGDMFGVSSNSILKRCKKLGIPLKGRGYWAKLKSNNT